MVKSSFQSGHRIMLLLVLDAPTTKKVCIYVGSCYTSIHVITQFRAVSKSESWALFSPKKIESGAKKHLFGSILTKTDMHDNKADVIAHISHCIGSSVL